MLQVPTTSPKATILSSLGHSVVGSGAWWLAGMNLHALLRNCEYGLEHNLMDPLPLPFLRYNVHIKGLDQILASSQQG